ncbi:hypothetical protein QKS52_gp2 [Odonatan anphe-related virus OKIAV59]|uniref:Uncharacterized protein n=1 Tax=Odonatan anphe-related virus OKIAV59 TaxID=2746375 RepID=A0AAE7IG94_9MONO|nr:hypothetical protein QKS52_gp2 [Odonatan anphe-related virus OKIAV59]QMP82149.1 hypothetical protein [Odonatan anphe-related virus OKIAV59]
MEATLKPDYEEITKSDTYSSLISALGLEVYLVEYPEMRILPNDASEFLDEFPWQIIQKPLKQQLMKHLSSIEGVSTIVECYKLRNEYIATSGLTDDLALHDSSEDGDECAESVNEQPSKPLGAIPKSHKGTEASPVAADPNTSSPLRKNILESKSSRAQATTDQAADQDQDQRERREAESSRPPFQSTIPAKQSVKTMDMVTVLGKIDDLKTLIQTLERSVTGAFEEVRRMRQENDIRQDLELLSSQIKALDAKFQTLTTSKLLRSDFDKLTVSHTEALSRMGQLPAPVTPRIQIVSSNTSFLDLTNAHVLGLEK